MSFKQLSLVSAVLVSLTSLVGAACSSGSGGALTSSGFCEAYAPCCAELGRATNPALCEQMFGGQPAADPAAAEQCFAELKEQASDPAFCRFELDEPEACDRAFPRRSGTRAPGATCTEDGQCAGANATCTEFGDEPGQCALYVDAAEGAPCLGDRTGSMRSWGGQPIDDEIPLCNAGEALVCAGGRCVRKAGEGGACSSAKQCTAETYCTDGTCRQRVELGERCDPSAWEDSCEASTHCAQGSATCEPRRANGESCEASAECLSDYCSESKCEANLGFAGLILGFVCR